MTESQNTIEYERTNLLANNLPVYMCLECGSLVADTSRHTYTIHQIPKPLKDVPSFNDYAKVKRIKTETKLQFIDEMNNVIEEHVEALRRDKHDYEAGLFQELQKTLNAKFVE